MLNLKMYSYIIVQNAKVLHPISSSRGMLQERKINDSTFKSFRVDTT
jgi:hypothetical protein